MMIYKRKKSLNFLFFITIIFVFSISSSNAQFFVGTDAFKQSDLDIMHKNWERLVEEDIVNKPIIWSNPETGHSGSQEVLKNYNDEDGLRCKTVKYVKKSKHIKNVFTYLMEKCLDESDGVWKFK
ncbi:MAG: hypothetical protein HRT94_09675 [Alphaproteobacteria bacterium]|nr:hypothetical protein [Alphaproteobacteria bacterium]